MFQHSKRFIGGFTLIEVLMYTLILAIITLAATRFVIEVIKGQNTSQSNQTVQESARFALEKITKTIRHGNDISVSQSVFDTHPGKLVITMPEPERNPIVFEIDPETKALTIQEGSNEKMNLTSNEVEVTELIFKNLTQPKVQPNIHIRFTISYKNVSGIPDFDGSFTLENTVSVRK